MTDKIERALKDLVFAVQNDSFNLTRDDQDSIEIKIGELKSFIQGKYESHQVK